MAEAFTSFSLNSSSTTSKAAIVHALNAEGNILCSNQVADISRGSKSNFEVTCKRCQKKLAPKAEVVKKPKATKAAKVSKKAQVTELASERTELALELLNVPRENRKQPEFVAKRVRLVELREKLAELGYEASTYQANAKALAGITFVTKKPRKSKKAA